MIPYAKHQVTAEDEAAVLRVLRSDHLTQGPEVEAFERELATVAGAKDCICVNSGTAALWLAYSIMSDGSIKMPTMSFVATTSACILAGRTPILCDVNRLTGLVEGDTTVGVTLGGQPTGHRHIILDACHGPLTMPEGTALMVASFHPAKHIACGEGGAVFTNDASAAKLLRALRDHGRKDDRRCHWPSHNFRMPEMSAALGRSQLQRYEANVQRRHELAGRYDEAFTGKLQTVPHTSESARHLYQILPENRDDVREALRRQHIQAQIHYRPIHLEPAYRERFGYKPGDFPDAEWFADHTLSLPLYPTLTEAEQDTVMQTVLENV